jgi:hypothetical protein
MFDPTIYENIKVVIEGVIYDLDLEGSILVTGRLDQIDLSSMSRSYIIQFKRKTDEVFAELRLYAGLKDLAAEILEEDSMDQPGCRLEIGFITKVTDVRKEGHQIHAVLTDIWDTDVSITQKISYTYTSTSKVEDVPNSSLNEITVDFNRKINEDQLQDIESLIDHVMRSLEALNQQRFKP